MWHLWRSRSRPAAVRQRGGDDRDDIQPGDKVLLIVENDLAFAKVLLEAARAGLQGRGRPAPAPAALAMVREYQPGGA